MCECCTPTTEEAESTEEALADGGETEAESECGCGCTCGCCN